MRDFGPDKVSTQPAFIEALDVPFLSSRDKELLRRQAGWPEKCKVVMACGVVHWRKQPETFIAVAEAICKTSADYRFIWIGDGHDLARMRLEVEKRKLSKYVHFIGHRDDFRDLLKLADVFALTSSEDPFPLVCLEAAAASAPSVVFREASGITALIEPTGEEPAGVAVTLGDEDAYASAVGELLRNDEKRERLARIARERLHERFTAKDACIRLLQKIQTVAKLRPRVSVIVPNYNYAPYLVQRLESISSQTFKDVEILLLDDASTDDSQKILTDFATRNPQSRLMLAKENGGSVFAAWERGIRAASGDLVWLAEADDWCDETFLEHAVGAFGTSGVHLAHGRSIPTNHQGEVSGDYNELYLDRIVPGRWKRSHCEPAGREINVALGRANSIPNASAVVVPRSCANRAIEAARAFKLAGDWAFYVTAAAGGRVAYVHEAVNYHRRHERTTTRSLEGTRAYFQELADVGELVRELYGSNIEREAAFKSFLRAEATRFNFHEALPPGRAPLFNASEHWPGVLYGVGDLSGGGAQMFAVRFANGWADRSGPVVLFTTGHEPDHFATSAAISPQIPVVTIDDIRRVGLGQFMQDWGLKVVVTGHWWADREIGLLMEAEGKPCPWAVVMHGCYENVLSNSVHFSTMRADFIRAERYCDEWIWTAEKNKKVFDSGLIKPRRMKHIVSGFEPKELRGLSRKDIGLPEEAFVFTLASRAIEQKGWYITVRAFQRLREQYQGRKDVRLLLIGDGPAAEDIKSKPAIDGVHLVGHTTALADYMHLTDVGLLPSWFAGESLPLVLIEFLAQAKPVIVSNVGECAWAIDAGPTNHGAGVVLELNSRSGAIDADELASAMKRFLEDPDLAVKLQPKAKEAFKKFEMTRMLNEYREALKEICDQGDLVGVSMAAAV